MPIILTNQKAAIYFDPINKIRKIGYHVKCFDGTEAIAYVDNKGNLNNILSLTDLNRQILNLPYIHITSIDELNSAV